MNWRKKGLIFHTDRQHSWMVSHASLPTVDILDDGAWRIYFGVRDEKGRSLTTFVNVLESDPKEVVYLHDRPILQLGKLGTFDDNGIMPSCLVQHGQSKYLYYIGWNPQVTVSYRLSIGLAVSEDGGLTFERYSEGPICDRSLDETYFNTAPYVIIDGGVWRMWYISCTGWEIVHRHTEPVYHVKYAESSDGIHWRKTGHVCIDYDGFTQAIGRPCVYRDGGLYKMFYSYRAIDSYRTDPTSSYRLGYAESADGLSWVRKDDEVGIARSDQGWDSEMIEYSHVFRYNGKTFMFYNGNGFGRSGFGYAILDE